MRRWIVGAGLLLAATLVIGRVLAGALVDAAWYSAVGVPALFWERLTNVLLLKGIAAAIGTLFAWANLYAVRKTIRAVALPARIANIEVVAMLPRRWLAWLTAVCAACIGAILAIPVDDWSAMALARHGVPFRDIDGILGQDLGYYVYRLPLEQDAYLWGVAALVITSTAVLTLYAMTGSARIIGRRLIVTGYVRRHLGVLGGILLVLLAWGFRLEMMDVVQAGSGPHGLFTRVDHIIAVPVDLALIAVCLCTALVCVWASWSGRLRVLFSTVSVVLVLALGGRHALPFLAERGNWLGDPRTRDASYYRARALYSRQAFDVVAVRLDRAVVDLPHGAHTEPPPIAAQWAERDLLTMLAGGTRSGATSEDPSWKGIVHVGTIRAADGHVGAILVDRPARDSMTWRLRQADLTADTLQVRPIVPAPLIGRNPEPHIGPLFEGFRVLRGEGPEVAVTLRSWALRVAHAWTLRDPSLLTIPADAQGAVRVQAVRDLRGWLDRIVPVFVQGSRITPIATPDGLVWSVPLYSASRTYPFSQPQDVVGTEFRYFRLAATAVLDAGTGRLHVIPVERPDPIARTWFARIAPLVWRAQDVPQHLRDQLPPNTEGAQVQIATLLQFGSRITGDEPLHVPDGILQGSPPPIAFVSTGAGAVPAWTVPAVDSHGTMRGWLTVQGGIRRMTTWTPTREPSMRWTAITQRLDSVLEVPGDSSRTTARSIGSSREPWGATVVNILPGPQGPRFWRARRTIGGGGRPLVERTAVLTGPVTRTGRGLAEALGVTEPTGRDREPRLDPSTVRPGTAPEQLRRWYESMRDALARGDWLRFGRVFDSLGAAVGRPPR